MLINIFMKNLKEKEKKHAAEAITVPLLVKKTILQF